MDSTWVRVSSAGGVTRLALARAEKRNALTREMLSEMTQALEQIKQDGQSRVLVVEAEGPVFCAGMDLGEMQERAAASDAAAQWKEDSRVYRRLVGTLFDMPIPTIAIVQGAAVAGGVGIVLACDLVLAAESAFFALPEPMRGITAAMVAPLLIFRVGEGNATTLLLSGERCSAERSLRIGLSYDVVPSESLAERGDQLIRQVLHGAPDALRITKEHIHRCAAAKIGDLLDLSIEVSATARESADAREGLAAFLERRPTRWQPE